MSISLFVTSSALQRRLDIASSAQTVIQKATQCNHPSGKVAHDLVEAFNAINPIMTATSAGVELMSTRERVEQAQARVEYRFRKLGYDETDINDGIQLGLDAIYGGGRVAFKETTIEAEVAKLNRRIAWILAKAAKNNVVKSKDDNDSKRKYSGSKPPQTRRRGRPFASVA